MAPSEQQSGGVQRAHPPFPWARHVLIGMLLYSIQAPLLMKLVGYHPALSPATDPVNSPVAWVIAVFALVTSTLISYDTVFHYDPR